MKITPKRAFISIITIVVLVVCGWFIYGFMHLSLNRATEVCAEKLEREFPDGNAVLGPDNEIEAETKNPDGSWYIERTWILNNPTWGLQKFPYECTVTGNNHVSQVPEFDLHRDENQWE